MNSLKDRMTELEREEIFNALKESNWIMVTAARMLGITERMIGYKIKKLGLRMHLEMNAPERWNRQRTGLQQ